MLEVYTERTDVERVWWGGAATTPASTQLDQLTALHRFCINEMALQGAGDSEQVF